MYAKSLLSWPARLWADCSGAVIHMCCTDIEHYWWPWHTLECGRSPPHSKDWKREQLNDGCWSWKMNTQSRASSAQHGNAAAGAPESARHTLESLWTEAQHTLLGYWDTGSLAFRLLSLCKNSMYWNCRCTLHHHDFLGAFGRMLVSLQPTSNSTHVDFGEGESILPSSTLENGVCDMEASQGSRCSH